MIMIVMIVMIVMITNGRGRKWKSTRGKEIGIELLALCFPANRNFISVFQTATQRTFYVLVIS